MPVGHRPPIPPGYAKVVLSGTWQGHQWRNIFYLAVAGSGITGTDLNTLATTIRTAWTTALQVRVDSTMILTQVTVIYIPSVGAELIGTDTTSVAGTSGGTAVADAGASYVLSWNINAYYRGGHPRWYISGVGTGNITNGSDITSAARTAIASAMNTFRSTINSATTTNITSVTIGTLSFQTAGAWRTPPLFRAFANSSVSPKLGTQRRRIHA